MSGRVEDFRRRRQVQPFGQCLQQMFDWALARQVKDDLVLVLPDLHGDLEQIGDDRRWSCLPQLLVQGIGGRVQQQAYAVSEKAGAGSAVGGQIVLEMYGILALFYAKIRLDGVVNRGPATAPPTQQFNSTIFTVMSS